MITVMPTLEIMKAIVDDNISSPRAHVRREAFDLSVELKSLGDVDILLEGLLYDRIHSKMESDHEMFFKSTCSIDYSAKDVTDYDIEKAINWVSSSESQARKVIIITDNVGTYSSNKNDNVRVMTPMEFVYSARKILDIVKSKTLISIDEFLLAVFFL